VPHRTLFHLLPSFLSLFATSALAAVPPLVEKVEPPNWWVRHTTNPVRLLVRGHHLAGARVETRDAALKPGPARVNAAGTYLFVDVTVTPAARPGPHQMRIVTAQGSAFLPLDLLPPLARQGRFQGFSEDDVIYLIMPDRFADGDPSNDDPPAAPGLLNRARPRYYHGGDLSGIVQRLPYLKDLGVTAIWLNPVYDNANRLNERERYDNQAITDYHGYGAVDFYAVDEHFGTLTTLRTLVEAAHRQGIKVIQDQVANHTGPYHPWVADSPSPTWYNGTERDHLANTWQTWTLMDPHATPEMRRATLDGWFLNILPDLNQDDPEVARYLIQNTLWWVGITGLDGIRQDTLPYVPRTFWRQWMAAIKREYPSLRVVGEVFDGDPAFVSFYQTGRAQFDGVDSGIDTLFDFPLFFPLRRAFAEGKSIRELARMFAHDGLYPAPQRLVTFLGLHDVERFMNVPGATVEGLKLAFTLLLTARGTPMIYYGDEIAMPGAGDPDNRRDFPGGWVGDRRNAFEAAGRSDAEQSVWSRVQALAHLRARHAALRRGTMANLAATDTVYAFERTLGPERVVVVLNNAATAADVELVLPGAAEGMRLRDALNAAAQEVVVANGGKLRANVGPRSAVVLIAAGPSKPLPRTSASHR
jgi:neopullulanase